MSITVGLDVGGAHLKVARLQGVELTDVRQFACPLWKGMDNLNFAFEAAGPMLQGASRFAITMTGELSDLFDSRAAGVDILVGRLTELLGPSTRYYLGARGFASADEAKARPNEIGSMNFLATAEVIGRLKGDGLLIDFGSTTVDIVAVADGRPSLSGLHDADRQATGELVYTGLTRTAVMGVAQRAALKGRLVGLTREYLATMADVRRVLGWDLAELDVHATADGRDKSVEESLSRMARMYGCDLEDCTPHQWRAAAAHLREIQLGSVTEGALQVLSAKPMPDSAFVVAAGIGAREAAEVSRRLQLRCETFGTLMGLSGTLGDAATHHAPAVAVAWLLDN